ncbi:hypothetical protein A5816_002964 [Enterococcus sp. 3G1_DIV0629]|nr:hypothetical protein A5816_002771 [Enterococcus sp. 3G1_DIV0629]OTO22292.1 hypothetical protein A5816_002964 [Enterococcus sp. 3G1_DIV0629]
MVLLVLLLVIASLYSFIFFSNAQKISTTGDIAFHFSRIKGLSSVFSGPINFTTFNSYGGGVNFFYPYLTLFPAVIFYWITNNLILSYILYVWILNICTILVSYQYGQKFFKRIDAAFLFSCLYSFYGYRLIDIYQRSAISESIALTIIPVVLYYTYTLLYERKNSVIPLAISMSLLIYTHVLSTFMSVIVIGFLFIGSLFSKRKEIKEMSNLILNMIKAVGWTILLTTYVWYPMLQQVLHQKINRPFRTNLQERALNISDSLIGAVNNDLVTFTMGTIGVVSLILPLFFLKKFANKEKIIYFCAVTTWFLSTNLFPWGLLQKTPIQIIQFPWRILGFQVLFGSLILTIVFLKWKTSNKKSMWSLVGIVLLIFTVTVATEANYSQKIQSYKGRLIMTKKDVTRYTTSRTGGLYDYAPLDALKYKDHLKKHEVKVDDRWENASHKSYNSKIIYTVEDANEQNITLPVFNYWGTVVKVNGKKSTIENDNGLVSIKGKGKRTIVEVSSTYPTTMILSLLISSITFIFLFTRYLIRSHGSIEID